MTYAKHLLDSVLREQLMTMLTWYVGVKTQFSRNPGYLGKHLQQYLDPELWLMLKKTYSDADYENIWNALYIMGDLFRIAANQVAENFGFDYPHADDVSVSAHLKHVRSLPKDAKALY